MMYSFELGRILRAQEAFLLISLSRSPVVLFCLTELRNQEDHKRLIPKIYGYDDMGQNRQRDAVLPFGKTLRRMTHTVGNISQNPGQGTLQKHGMKTVKTFSCVTILPGGRAHRI
jgi:hypothetical protein